MTEFYFIAALLLFGALMFVVLPLLKKPVGGAGELALSDENLAVYEARLGELKGERKQGLIDEQGFAALQDELALALLGDLDSHSPAQLKHMLKAWQPARGLALLACAALVAATVVLYPWLGAIDDVQLAQAVRVLEAGDSSADSNKIAELVHHLRRKLEQQPEDAESWYLLGHALMRQQSYPESEQAFAHLLQLVETDTNIEVFLAQAMFLARGGKIDEATRAVMQGVLQRIPNQPIVGEMMAMAAFQQQDYVTAALHLKRSLEGELTSDLRQRLQHGLERAVELAGDSMALQEVLAQTPRDQKAPREDAAAVVLDVEIQLGDLHPVISPQAVLFVMARVPGQCMPLAVVRAEIGSWPAHVRLDRSSNMSPEQRMTPGQEVEVVARVAMSGSVQATPGDLQTVMRLELTEGLTPVVLSFDKSTAPAVRLDLALSLAPGLEAAPDTAIYVIAREVGGPVMPIAVKRLRAGDLPTTLTLTDADSMLEQRKLSQFEAIEVLARLSRSGQPALAPGDREVVSAPIDPRHSSPVPLQIMP